MPLRRAPGVAGDRAAVPARRGSAAASRKAAFAAEPTGPNQV
ncbi:hypothetical protein [Gordonia malaquae]|nr:hypothetical protein [Gordonia malaquae]